MARVFKPGEEHREKCFAWVVTPDRQRDIMDLDHSIHKVQQAEEVRLFTEPIQSMIDFTRRETPIQESLSQYFESVKA